MFCISDSVNSAINLELKWNKILYISLNLNPSILMSKLDLVLVEANVSSKVMMYAI